MVKPGTPLPPQCSEEHCKDVRCRKPAQHDGLHEFVRPTGERFYWR